MNCRTMKICSKKVKTPTDKLLDISVLSETQLDAELEKGYADTQDVCFVNNFSLPDAVNQIL